MNIWAVSLTSQIGINYFGQSGELAGCINDALNVKQFLCGQSISLHLTSRFQSRINDGKFNSC